MTLLFRLAAVDTTLKACNETNNSILPSLYRCINRDATGGLQITGLTEVLQVIANVVELMLTVAGFIAVAMIIYAGFLYITSDGDPATLKRAKDTIFNTLLGLVIVLSAFGIVRYLTSRF